MPIEPKTLLGSLIICLVPSNGGTLPLDIWEHCVGQEIAQGHPVIYWQKQGFNPGLLSVEALISRVFLLKASVTGLWGKGQNEPTVSYFPQLPNQGTASESQLFTHQGILPTYHLEELW